MAIVQRWAGRVFYEHSSENSALVSGACQKWSSASVVVKRQVASLKHECQHNVQVWRPRAHRGAMYRTLQA